MKKTILVAAFTVSAFVNAQKVSDYQYISIPGKFETFKDNFKLDASLAKALKNKKYTVISSEVNSWPGELKNDPCKVLKVDILDDSSFLKNKLILQFKDCKGTVIASQKAGSSAKEFEAGFQEALKLALNNVPVSNPVATVTLSEIPAEVNLEKSITVSSPEKAAANVSKVKFSNGKVNLQKIQISDQMFILAEDSGSVPFASFYQSSMNGVFRVKLNSGEITVGYIENGTIVIDMPEGENRFRKEVFR